MGEDELAATVDHVAIDRLQRAYADAITCRAWDRAAALFLPTAVVRLDLVTRPGRALHGPDEVVSFIAGAVDAYELFEFVILNSHVDLWPHGDHDAATARLFMCEIRATTGEGGGPATRDDAFGLYRDRYVRTPDGWRIAARQYRSMGRFPSGDVFPLPAH